MQRATSSLCIAMQMFLLCFAPSCPSAQKYPKCWHDRHTQIRQKQHSMKTFCDPSFSNQTAGAVTQKCGSGFYREWAGPNRGQCVPCSCNGLSKECDERTGHCVKCQFNTTGDRCERCKEGYYGNPANRTCRACPCPFTENNFALACLDVGSGVVECLCKHGYSGVRCERCAFGYYGNPLVHRGICKPCSCQENGLNMCDSLTGECIPPGNSGCGDHCGGCDTCTHTLLVDLEQKDVDLFWLKQQLQNSSYNPVSWSSLANLEADISEAKIQMGRYGTAVRLLNPKVEQLEADVAVDRYDLYQLIDENLHIAPYLKKILESANETKLKAEDLFEAGFLLTTIHDLIKRLTEVKPEDSVSLSEKDKRWMMEDARRTAQEMRDRGCTAQRDKAGNEQDEAHKLLDLINNDVIVPAKMNQFILIQSSDSIMATDAAVREVDKLLLNAEDTVDTAQGLNLKSHTTLQHLQALKAQLDKEQSTVPPVTEMTKDLLKNITGIISVIEEIKKGFENQSAQLDDAKPKLFKKLNNSLQMMAKVETITKAKEHAEELNGVATELQQVLHTTTSGTLLDSLLATEAYDSIINAVGMAEKAANEPKKTAGQASKDVKKGGLVTRAEQLKNYSTHLWSEASDTQSHLKMLSSTVNAHRNCVKKQKKKGESLRMDTSAIGDSLKKISREDTAVLIGSVREAACAASSAVSNAKARLRNISEEVGRITSTNISVNIEDILTDADQAVKGFDKAFPVMSDKLAQVKALARKMSPKPNMTESIQRIKDIIEETRNFVNMLSLAITFNGKGHTELHPPRNLEDVKAFTAVDLLLNRHHKHPSKSDARRKQRQDNHRDANHFVFYLGNKNALGDYIGMAVRSSVLVCVYKLGGVVHEVETSKITVTNVNSSDFDRVIFHRVYQDAEVNITQNFTSQKPISLPPKRNLPNQMAGVLDLDPDSIVFYVGGYPDDFTPPVELRYPRYRGAIKFSHLNGNPICLYNYKHAANMDAKQRTVKIAEQELSDYYEGRGYRMAFIKDPGRKKRRLFKFHTNSREINALLFYIGNEESFFCVFVERGFLVLQGQQADREIRLQSAERVSLFDTQFAIVIADKFTVHYGPKKISTDHIQTNYMNYYVGGLPAQLRERHNITAAPLRGCVDRLTADAEIVEYNRTIGVGNGCPVSLLGVRAATLNSSLSVDSPLVWDEQPLRVSLSFRSTGKQGVILKSSSQGSEPISNLQLSLADGFVVFHSFNYTLRSDERYNDGVWHYLSAVGKPSGLMLNIDNVNVRPGHSDHIRLQGGKFRGCVANLYTSRSSILPADLSSLSQAGDIVFGQCSLPVHPNSTIKRSQTHNPTLAGSQCRPQRANQLYEEDSWVSYTLPQEDLNYRPHFSLDIKTKSPKGLILHIAGRGTIPLLALYMANGKIKMSLGQNRIIQHKERSNDGNWHRVEFSVEKSTFHLLVDGIRVTDGHLLDSEGSSLNLDNPVYLGADMKSRITKGHSIPTNTVISCIREFKMNDVFVGAPEVSHKASPCFDGLTEEGTYFGGGHIILDNYFTVGSHFELSFELRPQQLTGLLFHVQSDETSLNVFLMENKVGVKVNDGNGAVSVSVTPRKSLCDGKFHEVTVSKQNKVLRLVVDSTSQEKAGLRSTWYSTALDSLYIGGTTNQIGAPVSSPFVGCLRKVEINGKLVAFERDSRVVHPVSINRCPAN